MNLQGTKGMEVFCTVSICRAGGRAPSTGKVFLGKLSEAVAQVYFEKFKKFKVLHRNLHLGWGEVDLIVRDPLKSAVWIVEVRSRNNHYRLPAYWLSPQKIMRLKRLAAVLSHRWNEPFRIVLLQVQVKARKTQGVIENNQSQRIRVRADCQEFEITD